MSSTDKEDTFVLVGRNNDIEVIGPDCATDHEVIGDISSTKDNYDAAESSSAKACPSNCPLLTTTKSELISEPISKLLQGYFKSAPVPLHLLSGAGIIIWANDLELRLVGYTADEYIGHEIVEVRRNDCDKHRDNISYANYRDYPSVFVSRRGQKTSRYPS